mgnify:CR=1 FL=1
MKQAKQAKQAGEDTFVFCPSFYQQLRAIKNNEVRLRLYESVAEYGVFGAVPDFTEIDPMGLMNGVFAAIKYVIDSTKSKRSNISNIRSNAGKNGGAPKGNQNARKQAKTSKTNKTSVDVDVDVDENIKKLSNESKESADKPRTVASKRPAFVAPSLETLQSYFPTIGGTAQVSGKTPMKNWQAAARNWVRRKSEFSNTTAKTTTHETTRKYNDL